MSTHICVNRLTWPVAVLFNRPAWDRRFGKGSCTSCQHAFVASTAQLPALDCCVIVLSACHLAAELEDCRVVWLGSSFTGGVGGCVSEAAVGLPCAPAASAIQ